MSSGLEIAVIGMVGRFPGARSLEELWHNLCGGVESISSFTREELLASGLGPAELEDPNFVPARGVIEGADLFDPSFFDFTLREAQLTDPQHRIFLECAWEALETAGYAPESYPGRIGVFAGVSMSTYLLLNLISNGELMSSMGSFQTLLGNDKDFLPTRVSYKLNLKGPSVLVQTACSTSLVAVHLAGQSLLSGECEMALAGGVSISFPQKRGYVYQNGAILSPDGRCRPFDAAARGTVNSDGVGLVVLKRLEDALQDGDTIRAVILGSAINNDGSAKVGYTAPSVEGQSTVISAAQVMAGVTADTIDYVEAHGTGTSLGDPIEVAALTQAFRATTDRRSFCAIGSLKGNVGHLDAAAGVASLIKAVLALERRAIPPLPSFERPNPEIDFESSPFFASRELRPWAPREGPRRAGVSSFGIGGTNAHVVLEEAPPAPETSASRPCHLLLVSARSEAALERSLDALAAALEERPGADLADVAFTLKVGRTAFVRRRALVCRHAGEALEILRERDPKRLLRGIHEAGRRPVCFLFPGQGAQYPGMAAEVYQAEPVFRRELERCAGLLRPLLGVDPFDLLFPRGDGAESAAERLRQTAVAQPVLFSVEYALARLWMQWGVEPAAMIGHSVGEYVAACLAGVLSLEDALRLVAARGRIMQRMPPGAMLSVPLPAERLEPLLEGGLALAAVNAPSLCVVAGPPGAVDRLRGELAGQGVEGQPLHVSHAFHSPAMEPAQADFLVELRGVTLHPPQRRYLSNVTGGWITDAEATDPHYWARHLRQPVNFSAGAAALLAEPDAILLEVGPGRTLGSLVRQQPAWAPQRPVLASLPQARSGEAADAFLLGAAARLWLAGGRLDWAGFYGQERRRRVPLPTYPFERRSCWVEPRLRREETGGGVAAPGLEPAAEPVATAAQDRPALATAYAAPGSELERGLAEIWRDLLGVADIGLHDDFFELGGHSLLATQALARVREVLGIEIPLRRFMEAPTLADLAQACGEGKPQRHLPELQRLPREGDPPLSFAQERLWFLDQLEPGSPAYNMAFAIRLRGSLDENALERSFSEIQGRHESLRTVFTLSGGKPAQRILAVERLSLPRIDLRELPVAPREEMVSRLVAEDALLPFSLTEGPLFRVRLVRLAAEESVLLVAFHHIIADGWSFGVIARELSTFYALFTGLGATPPSELAAQYADFAYWQRQWLQGDLLEAQLAYWRRQLAHIPPELRLPTDRFQERSIRGAVHPLSLPADLAGSLLELGRRRRSTLFMTLLAAFDILLHVYSGQEDIVVGSPIAGRARHQQLEGMVGFFVNTLVLRSDLSGDPTFEELLDRVRRLTLDAYAHQDLPFERLVSALRLDRDLHRTPLFRVWLVLQNTPAEEMRLPGVTAVSVKPAAAAVRHDLKLDLMQGADGLHGFFEYKVDLFDRETIERMAELFELLLRRIVEQPQARLGELAAVLVERMERRREETKKDLRAAALEKLASRRRVTA